MTKFMKLDIQKFALITRENSVSSNSPASTQAKGTLYVGPKVYLPFLPKI